MRYRSFAVFLAVMMLLCGCASDEAELLSTVPQLSEEPTAAPTEEPTTAPTTEPATEPEPQEERFVLTFAGDCTLGANPEVWYAGYAFIKSVGEDWLFPFQNVVEYFENDDFTLVNLEGTLCDGGTPVPKQFNFRGPTSYVHFLTENAVEAVTLANNHSMDYGDEGYASTVETLEQAQVAYVEKNGTRLITTERGLTIGLVGSSFPKADMEEICAQISGLKEQGADIVVFAVHWGIEGSYHPKSIQVEQAHAAIDAGADIVYGSHPHVLQPIEEYNGGIIYYSMGNFCFGGNLYPRDKDTVLLQQEVIRDAEGNVTLGELTIIPASVSSIPDRNNFQPTPYEPGTEEYDRAMSKLDGTWAGSDLVVE